MDQHSLVAEAIRILVAMGMPLAQQNERSALILLALLNLSPGKTWAQAEAPLLGITPIMDFISEHYGKKYAPNSRETIRKETVQPFVAAAIAKHNPDDLSRPVNSPKAVYQIEPNTLTLLKTFGSDTWYRNLQKYLSIRETLVARYAHQRQQHLIPVQIASEKTIHLSPGKHSNLIKAIIEEFAPRFAPGSILIYVGDTGEKWGYFDQKLLADLGVTVDAHGKMPDVVLYYQVKGWLLLIESVTSRGPVNAKRHDELMELFADSSAGLVYVTAFPSRSVLKRHLADIAWETEVWVADAPSHI